MIRVIELFSGIGSQHAALERLGIPYQIVGMAEIDKYAIKSYEAIHGATHNYGDISKIDRLGKADFWTYSFPCQDISVAGKQRGINEGTRSGLLYEVERLLEVAEEYDELPTYLMLENVKNLVGKKFKSDFDKWIGKLNELGYNTYWKVLNAKHYGVPQNRERVFAISIKKEFDMDYRFPEGFDNGLRLKDILEEEVDEKFYFSIERVGALIDSFIKKGQEYSYCIDANYYRGTTPELSLAKSRRQLVVVGNRRLRKLTPLETWRLTGFTDEQFRKAEAVNSNSQLFKQAGNSIVVDVLYHLFKNLFLESDGEDYYQQLKMEG